MLDHVDIYNTFELPMTLYRLMATLYKNKNKI